MVEFLLFLMLATNPQCKAIEREFLVWAPPSAGGVEMAQVPMGKAWLVRAAGLHTSYPNPAIWSIELKRPVWSQGGICCHQVVLERSDWRSGTPPLALSRPIILYEGESLVGRMCCMELGFQFGISAIFYEVDQSCMPVESRG